MNYDTPTNRSRWTPADADVAEATSLDFANAYSGIDLTNTLTGETFGLTNREAIDLAFYGADRAEGRADEALARLARLDRPVLDLSNEQRDLDLSNAATDDSDAALLARWDEQR